MQRKTRRDTSPPRQTQLVTEPTAVSSIEARNGLRQFDEAVARANSWLRADDQFALTPSFLQDMNRLAIEGIWSSPGTFRTENIEITGSQHTPPTWQEVPRLVEEICEYVGANWHASAIHLCAYLMWRINWVHPFVDGNGRTTRIVSYSVLCVRLGHMLPGTRTIPEQIAANKTPYYVALDAADAAWSNGRIDVSDMEHLLEGLLAAQLYALHQEARADSG